MKQILLFVLLIFNCCQPSTSPDENYIEDPHDRWQSFALKNYTLEQARFCYCPAAGEKVNLDVKNKIIISGTVISTNQALDSIQLKRYKTVDQLFEMAVNAENGQVASYTVKYDSLCGYPEYIFIDYNANIVDEEIGYRSKLISIARRNP